MTLSRVLSQSALMVLVAGALTAPAAAVEGLHIFTFNQVRQTEEWRRALLHKLVAAPLP